MGRLQRSEKMQLLGLRFEKKIALVWLFFGLVGAIIELLLFVGGASKGIRLAWGAFAIPHWIVGAFMHIYVLDHIQIIREDIWNVDNATKWCVRTCPYLAVITAAFAIYSGYHSWYIATYFFGVWHLAYWLDRRFLPDSHIA